MLCYKFSIPKTPMWVGFNSLIYENQAPLQKVAYLIPTKLSHIEKFVIYLTLKQAPKIAEKYKETDMQVTYDLRIPKTVMQIQVTKTPLLQSINISWIFSHDDLILKLLSNLFTIVAY